jgi:hypothetical protein
MYYSEKGPYKRGAGGQAITFENSAVLVHGYMEPDTYHPLLNISVIPQVRYKLASQVWKRLYKAKRSRYTGGAASTMPHSSTLRTMAVALLAVLVANPAVLSSRLAASAVS